MSVALEDYEEMRDALREVCLKLEAENVWLTAYARELQERISTLVNENERLMDKVRNAR
jgi:hypothetical protein